MSVKNTRTAQYEKNGKWVSINPIDIKAGMFFKIFEEDGTPVVGPLLDEYMIAYSDAYYNEEGAIAVQIVEVTP
jgi:hypothetical protein